LGSKSAYIVVMLFVLNSGAFGLTTIYFLWNLYQLLFSFVGSPKKLIKIHPYITFVNKILNKLYNFV